MILAILCQDWETLGTDSLAPSSSIEAVLEECEALEAEKSHDIAQQKYAALLKRRPLSDAQAAEVYYRIAANWDQQSEWAMAIEPIEIALKLDRKLNNPLRVMMSLWYAGSLNEKLRNFSIASQFLNEAITIATAQDSPYLAQLQKRLKRIDQRAAQAQLQR